MYFPRPARSVILEGKESGVNFVVLNNGTHRNGPDTVPLWASRSRIYVNIGKDFLQNRLVVTRGPLTTGSIVANFDGKGAAGEITAKT